MNFIKKLTKSPRALFALGSVTIGLAGSIAGAILIPNSLDTKLVLFAETDPVTGITHKVETGVGTRNFGQNYLQGVPEKTPEQLQELQEDILMTPNGKKLFADFSQGAYIKLLGNYIEEAKKIEAQIKVETDEDKRNQLLNEFKVITHIAGQLNDFIESKKIYLMLKSDENLTLGITFLALGAVLLISGSITSYIEVRKLMSNKEETPEAK
ncbi:MAG: hypothetical protein ACRC42_00505 [Mycoplasma sp.]